MEINKNCSVIKTEELNSLHREISTLKNKLQTDLYDQKKSYEEQLESLRKTKKPEEINVNIIYREKIRSMHTIRDRWGGPSYENIDLKNLSPDWISIRTTFNLAGSLSNQIYNIGKLMYEKHANQWKHQEDRLYKELEEKSMEISRVSYEEGIKDAVKLIRKYPFKRKKSIIKILKSKYNEKDN